MKDEELWFWHEKCQDFRYKDISQSQYCKNNSLDLIKFRNMYYRIDFNKSLKPESYEYNINMANKYLESDVTKKEFIKNNNINKGILCQAIMHINYSNRIELLKKNKNSTSKSFIQIPSKITKNSCSSLVESEVIKNQNDLEIIISCGIKVVIASNIETEKIIKIIELLKDL